MSSTAELIADLRQRDLIRQTTGDGEFEQHVLSGSRTLYCGFDPTADSLHIGHLVPLLMLRRFQQAGHRPIALVGGATGLIGDPSFKAQERRLNTADVVAQWSERLRAQVSRFIDFDTGANGALVVNNFDWTGELALLDFLRDVGKYFSVNAMIHKESVRQRLEREGEGISFTEFSYMLLQSYDFAELNRRFGCTVQLGGSDQWGNIVGGIELARRLNGNVVYGMTVPLVTKSDGSKFGKTETGTVWLDSAKTSPYAFYQFWMNAADADVYRFLRYFTFLPVSEIDDIQQADNAAAGRPQAQSVLARAMTELVHGAGGVSAAIRITRALFEGDPRDLSEDDFRQLRQDGLPTSRLTVPAENTLTNVLTESGLAVSGKQVKDALANRGVQINGVSMGLEDNAMAKDCFSSGKALFGCYFLVRLGKKKYHLFEVAR